ncbi:MULTISPECIES: enoyl-ACP reductase FabI [Hyphomicrobiales]|uniref:enoyl-ACP reductase FabI n=1 Tax=Hyphomicrobiales TaxID=356 RepID=UPI000C647658|nr:MULTISPECIES: enoyl-ACP reductase FabI [Hyphomicrobiales]MAA99220.1 enoyl-[acyl-carrier-protein] reductase FabI [Stappia sp.]MAM93386.1 enoyl-[acyl-carrier-protein] reductase FabI [Parvibaculum sp.]MBM19477.1 enoyl-[acyl-carrier-protein] reductase FabI [Stappia sp.]NIJ42843.1 enoyl-[acyl-carrier protein] reductase I [Parvibaculum indicum]|tara:strand:+ start:774 stop:1547 length:774 start_codon:yes stop_codon:yes gene_type:complete
MRPIIDLTGKRGLVVGIANEHSIAAGCAAAFRQAGAQLAVTYLNEKALPFVQPVAEAVAAPIIVPCDVRVPGQLEAVFERIERDWGQLDFLLHSIAFAPREDLQTSLVNCSAEGFALAMDVSCHSFIRMAKLAAPLMKEGGALLTVSFYGADRVIENYNLMGPVKAALESSVRYLAADLAARGIRANTISAGAIRTRAASGIDRFDELLDKVRQRTPANRLVGVEDVGRVAAFLASEAGSSLTGSVVYADGGFHTVA